MAAPWKMQQKDKNGMLAFPVSMFSQAKLYMRHDMSVLQREEYIHAVLCLQSLPPKADQTKYPGVKNRYDDFVLTHETQALHLHSTVS